MNTATHINDATYVNETTYVDEATHVNHATHVNEGRTFFVVINILIGMSVLLTVAAVGVLVLAAVSG